MRTPPEMTCSFLIQLVFCGKKKWFIGVEVEQETSAPPPKKNPESAPVILLKCLKNTVKEKLCRFSSIFLKQRCVMQD